MQRLRIIIIFSLYLKLIHVGDFKKTEEVMSTMTFGPINIVVLLVVVIVFILIHVLKALLLKSLYIPLMNRLALICFFSESV